MHRCLGLAIHLRKARVDALRLQRNGIPGSEIDQLGKVPTASGKDIKILQHCWSGVRTLSRHFDIQIMGGTQIGSHSERFLDGPDRMK